MNPSEKRFIAVVMGGVCGERGISIQTGTCVTHNLVEAGHRVLPVCIHADGKWELGTEPSAGDTPESWFAAERQSPLAAVTRILELGVECVFNGLHGPGGEDGIMQGFLRQAGLPFTGPDVTPAAVTMDKALTKAVLQEAGIRTPRGFRFPPESEIHSAAELEQWIQNKVRSVPFPWILKPNCLGSSVGIELFQNPEELLERASEVSRNWHSVQGVPGSGFLVEEQLAGRELTCGVLESSGAPARAFSPIEIRPVTSEFFDYHAKYTKGATEEICPAELDPLLTRKVQETAVRVHEIFECAPLSRTDMFLDPEGELAVLEINTLPGMTATSLIPQSAIEAGMSLPELFSQLIQDAIERETLREAIETL